MDLESQLGKLLMSGSISSRFWIRSYNKGKIANKKYLNHTRKRYFLFEGGFFESFLNSFAGQIPDSARVFSTPVWFEHQISSSVMRVSLIPQLEVHTLYCQNPLTLGHG